MHSGGFFSDQQNTLLSGQARAENPSNNIIRIVGVPYSDPTFSLANTKLLSRLTN
jgi:hypothetical protein